MIWWIMILLLIIAGMGATIKILIDLGSQCTTELSQARANLDRLRQTNIKLKEKIDKLEGKAAKKARRPKGPNINKFVVGE